MDTSTGVLVSEFVKQRTAAVEDQTRDLWIESVCAGLFAVCISTVLSNNDALESAEAFERHCNEICTEVAQHANSWMDESLSLVRPKDLDPRVKVSYELYDIIRGRLAGYFNAYLTILDNTELSSKEARWTAISSGLTVATERPPYVPRFGQTNQRIWVEQVVQDCKRLTQDLPEYAR